MFNNQQIKKLQELSDAILLLGDSVQQLREEVDYLVHILDTDD